MNPPQVDPGLTALGCSAPKLEYDEPLSKFAFNLNLRPSIVVFSEDAIEGAVMSVHYGRPSLPDIAQKFLPTHLPPSFLESNAARLIGGQGEVLVPPYTRGRVSLLASSAFDDRSMFWRAGAVLCGTEQRPDGSFRLLLGGPVQVDPGLTALGFSVLKLKYDELLSDVAFRFNLRRYRWAPPPPPPTNGGSGTWRGRAGRAPTLFAHSVRPYRSVSSL